MSKTQITVLQLFFCVIIRIMAEDIAVCIVSKDGSGASKKQPTELSKHIWQSKFDYQ